MLNLNDMIQGKFILIPKTKKKLYYWRNVNIANHTVYITIYITIEISLSAFSIFTVKCLIVN